MKNLCTQIQKMCRLKAQTTTLNLHLIYDMMMNMKLQKYTMF